MKNLKQLFIVPMFAVAITATGQKSNPPVLGNGGYFSIDKVTDTSVSMSWEPATDDNTPREQIWYQIIYYDPNECGFSWSKWKFFPVGTSLSMTLSRLKKNTVYPISIMAVDVDGNSYNYQSPLNIGDKQSVIRTDNGKGPTPGIATIKAVTSRSITLNWTPATDDATIQRRIRYRIAWGPAQALMPIKYTDIIELEKEGTEGVKDGSYTIDGLEPDTEYQVNILTIDDAEHGNFYWPLFPVQKKCEPDL